MFGPCAHRLAGIEIIGHSGLDVKQQLPVKTVGKTQRQIGIWLHTGNALIDTFAAMKRDHYAEYEREAFALGQRLVEKARQ